MPADYILFLQQLLQEARPDVDLRNITPVYDLLLTPHALLTSPLKDDINTLKLYQSVRNALKIPEADFDALMANFIVTRQTGSRAIGTVRVSFAAPVTVAFGTTDIFTSNTGLNFSPVRSTSVPASVMVLNQDGGTFYAEVAVIAAAEGEAYRLAAHSIQVFRGTLSGFTKVDNPFGFSGGTNRETNAQILARASDAIAVRDLVTGRGIRSTLQQNFPQIKRLKVIGYLDPGQDRDIVGALHIGGQADIFLKADSLLTESVKIQTPIAAAGDALDGSFSLFAVTSPAAAKRPVVSIPSVRLLDSLAVPTGSPLSRVETSLVAPRSLEPTRILLTPHLAVSKSLNTVHVVVAEQASARDSFINYAKFNTLGTQLTGFVRISTSSRSPSKPFIAVNGSLAFIFWSAQGEIHYTVLNIAGPSYTVVKSQTPLITGNDALDTMDTAFDADGNIHIVIARILAAGDESQLLIGGNIKRQVWYAKLLPTGLPPSGFVPRVLVQSLPGSHISPRIAAQGVGATVKATVVFTIDSGSFSNLGVAQVDSTGASLTSNTALPITSSTQRNEFPLIGIDSANKLNVVWVENRTTFNFLKLDQNAAFLVVISKTKLFTRAAAVTEADGEINPSDFLQITWVEGVQNQSDVFTSKVSNRGLQVGTVTNVSNSPSFSFGASIVLDVSGDIHMVWADGTALASLPFYTKRKPQDYSVLTKLPGLRYSMGEEMAISTQIAAPNGIGVDVSWAPLVAAVQTYMNDDDNRVVVAGLMARHFVPAEVTLTLAFSGPASLTAAQVVVQTTVFLNALTTNVIDASVLISELFKVGATSVDSIKITAVVDGVSGVLETLTAEGGAALTLPANASVSVKSVIATKKG